MSDKVIVSKQDANDLPFVEQEHSGDKYVLLEDIKHWLMDATPVSGEVVGYIDEFGNFENNLKPWMTDEPNVIWEAVYTTPQPADTVPVERFNKLVWALKHVKPSARSVDPNAWDTIEKALAEAIKGE